MSKKKQANHAAAATSPISPHLRTAAAAALPPPQQQHIVLRFAPYLLALLAVLLYVGTLGHGFVLDDPMSVTLNQYVQKGIGGIPDILTSNYRAGVEGANSSGQVYRPASLIVFAVAQSCSPNNAFLLHLINVLLYALSAVAVWGLYQRLLPKALLWVALLGTALFVAHPLHTEVVANIKSCDELLSLLGIAAALYCCARHVQHPQHSPLWIGLGMAAFMLALLSKESAITMLPVFGLVAYVASPAPTPALRYLSWLLWAAVPVAVFLAMRYYAIHNSVGIDTVSKMDNPLIEAANYATQLGTGLMVSGKYLLLLLLPYPLSYDYSFNALPLVSLTDYRALLSLLVYVVLIGWALWQLPRRSPLSLAILAFVCALSVASQVLLVIGVMFGERLSYLPSLWFCLGLSYAVYIGLRKIANTTYSEASMPVAFGGVMLLLVALGSISTWSRAADWKDNLSLFSADAPKYPNSVRLNDNLSTELYNYYTTQRTQLSPAEQQKILDQIVQHSEQSLRIAPSTVAHLNIGNALIAQNKLPEAEQQYLKSLELNNGFAPAMTNLAALYRNMGQHEGQQNNNISRALELLQKSVQYNPNDATTYNMLGAAHGMLQHHTEAVAMFEKSLSLNPNDQTVLRNLIQAYQNSGNTAKVAELSARLNNVPQP